MVEARKKWFRAELKERVNKELGESSWDTLDHIRRSHWMTRVYVEDVLRPLAPGAVFEDDEDLKSCYTDGSSDAGCDFICRNDGTVTIVQAKYRSDGKDESPAEFDSFADVLARLHPHTGARGHKNKAVRDAADDIDWHNDRFELHFVTLGRVDVATATVVGASVGVD